ncbi:pyruvate:ferredoxin oxidoreductase [Johnsonella ignava ATCC 51276]|uniref:Pyruvate:ferredoxin oxidoreductase n=1 Tax=Johnsonella ignava ATCC 51276 TaxID=679200 RepID=G5GJR7_9FIRM|nr:pyruvate:ferredoxin (flavodoxin) oxidoreductase [Johnsonella ignava]EHI54960.1 pyruvate:ferredoxin oxidoreductase [Johnsonella ignava ATCC 51276]
MVVKTMDGNEAAAYISYAFTEVATIYPITPSSPMAEAVDLWSAQGKKNIFGQRVRLEEMQSEAGAAGAMHGALETGALATTYTASQGLLLMIPPLYRLSGQLLPGVLHVSARVVGTHAFSIFGEHSDVMACRQTGLAMLCSGSVQEVMDLAGVAHLSAIKGRVPFIHFFDGFRTSHEIQKIEALEYDELEKLLDYGALDAFRKRSLNPERPVMRSSVQNPDVYFQARESANSFYDAIPGIVEGYMNDIKKITGREYKLFSYYGPEDAEHVIISMGSSAGVIKETVDYLNKQGRKTGYIQVYLYRPFSIKHFLKEVPETVKKITVLDRTKEPGSLGEPLYLDICAAFNELKKRPEVYAGRYGLSIKDVTPDQIIAVFDNMLKEESKNHFTVGINDDVTFTSLPLGEMVNVADESIVNCKFWGLGSDGTVGANKNSIKIIGDHTDLYAQAYFEYDTKKSGGLTRSHLRFGKKPIIGSYLITKADFVACHNQSYINRYDIVEELKPEGTFLLNCTWDRQQLEDRLSDKVKKYIYDNKIKFYTINAIDICKEIGLGNRTNGVLQAAFFALSNIIPMDDAIDYMKQAIVKTYGKKGDKVIAMNNEAVELGAKKFVKIDVPESWGGLVPEVQKADEKLSDFVARIAKPINDLKGDLLPVSAFVGREDGTVPLGTSMYDKRGVAIDVPRWDKEKCIQCNQCSYVCPHACIRPYLLNESETANAPEKFDTVQAKGKGLEPYKYRMQVSVLDCISCGSCVAVCPAKGKALFMESLDSQKFEAENWEYAQTLSYKENPLDKKTVKGSQFEKPLLEFSGACAGCGETPYMKLLTQMFGERLIVANATGCTQAWGAAMPCFPYTTNHNGCGPAWSNSLFENNAEFALGMCLAETQQRENLVNKINDLAEMEKENTDIQTAVKTWFDAYNDGDMSKTASNGLLDVLNKQNLTGASKELYETIKHNKEHLSKKSIWMYGGDGWAYDIGYGGLDHVLASGRNLNILLVDTEVYSNTGGQSSKASPVGAVAKFAASGKKTKKKDLGLLAMSYGYVYVAQVAMGANQNQLIKAIQEAEDYDGPSLVIAYAPCVAHGLVKGMANVQEEMNLAVKSGYWNLYRYNPLLKKEGKNPFILDSKKPTLDLKEFLMGEVRFASLYRTFPDEAQKLLAEAEQGAKEKYEEYERLALAQPSGGKEDLKLGA